MAQNIFTVLLLTILPAHLILGYGTGAPSASCEHLTPFHGQDLHPQSIPSPYEIVLEETHTRVKQPLVITLKSKQGSPGFKGFLVLVRRVVEREIAYDEDEAYDPVNVGQFETDLHNDDIRPLPCSGKPNAAVTHNHPKPKETVQARWVPFAPGQYLIQVTFVQNKETYWANQTKLIEVLPEILSETSSGFPDCSTLKISPNLSPPESSNPYTIAVGPQEPSEKSSHHVYQNQQMWINMTSEYGTPIFQAFVQVRPLKPNGEHKAAAGEFIKAVSKNVKNFELLDCFNQSRNAILFTSTTTDSDVSFLWKAPPGQVGKFIVTASAMRDETTFWDQVADDTEAAEIIVLKKDETNHQVMLTVSPSTSSSADSFLPHSAFGAFVIWSLLLF